MPDVRDQLRVYFDEVDPPFDVPDLMREPRPELAPTRSPVRNGLVVAMVAAVVVVLVVGLPLLLSGGQTESAVEPTVTTAGPVTTTLDTAPVVTTVPEYLTETVTTTANPEDIDRPDFPSRADEARHALADALIVIGSTEDLSRHLDALWAALSDPGNDIGTSGWVQDCCAEEIAAIRGLLPTLHDQSNVCEGYTFVPCSLTNLMDTALDDIDSAIAAFAAADGRDRATESLADASYALIRFNERLTELITLDLRTFLANAGSPSYSLKDDALQDVLETLALARNMSAQLTLLSVAIEDSSLSLDTPDWVESCCGDLVRLSDILSHMHVAADACETGYGWVPCSLTNDIGAEIDRIEAALAEFRSATSHSDAAHALATTASALTRINQPAAELIRINICAQGGVHPGPAEVTRCRW